MMKSKKLTYVMVVLTTLIWGMIFYKVYKALSGDDTPVFILEHVPVKGSMVDYAVQKDTARLLLNYRDPFSTKKSELVETQAIQPVEKILRAVSPKAPINWSVIRYSGFVNNPGSKKLIAMISVNGKELMLSEGETGEQVRLVKNLRDSIKVTYQGVTKFITLNRSL